MGFVCPSCFLLAAGAPISSSLPAGADPDTAVCVHADIKLYVLINADHRQPVLGSICPQPYPHEWDEK